MSPWDQVLAFLEKVIIPDWGALVALAPLFGVLGLLGPVFTLLALAWLHHRVTRRAGRVRIADPDPMPAQLDEDGEPIVPANVPFCVRDALLYPATATTCERCGDELKVRCPVDGTTRTAGQQLCRACGTKYVLGASSTPVTIRRSGRPPAGGAAAA